MPGIEVGTFAICKAWALPLSYGTSPEGNSINTAMIANWNFHTQRYEISEYQMLGTKSDPSLPSLDIFCSPIRGEVVFTSCKRLQKMFSAQVAQWVHLAPITFQNLLSPMSALGYPFLGVSWLV